MRFQRITIHNDPLAPSFASGSRKNLPLTDAAERAVRNATQAAVDRAETGLLSPVYLLWAILSAKGTGRLGLGVLESCGVDLATLEQTAMSLIHVQSGQSVGGGLDLTQFGRIIERAGVEARALEQTYIGTEHLLLAFLRFPYEVAGQVLMQTGVTVARYATKLNEMLGQSALPKGRGRS